MPKQSTPDFPRGKVACSIEEILKIHPTGRTHLYNKIKSGDLVARKDGRSTIILRSDYLAFLNSLPTTQSS